MLFDIDVGETVRTLFQVEGDIYYASGKALEASATAGTKHAQGTTLFKDGTNPKQRLFTRKSIKPSVDKLTQKAKITAGGASLFLEWGTKAHGNHPGITPRPFMQEARDEAEKVLDYGLEYYIGEAVRD